MALHCWCYWAEARKEFSPPFQLWNSRQATRTFPPLPRPPLPHTFGDSSSSSSSFFAAVVLPCSVEFGSVRSVMSVVDWWPLPLVVFGPILFRVGARVAVVVGGEEESTAAAAALLWNETWTRTKKCENLNEIKQFGFKQQNRQSFAKRTRILSFLTTETFVKRREALKVSQKNNYPVFESVSKMGNNSNDPEELFCLRWNDYRDNVVTTLSDLRREEDFFDVTLAVDGRQVRAHKLVRL